MTTIDERKRYIVPLTQWRSGSNSGSDTQVISDRFVITDRAKDRRVRPPGFTTTQQGPAETTRYTTGLYWYQINDKWGFYRTYTPFTGVPLPEAPNALLGLNIMLRNKIQERSVNLGASVFEYKQSIKLFVDVAKGLASLYRDLKRGRFDRTIVRPGSSRAARRENTRRGRQNRRKSKKAMRGLGKKAANTVLLSNFGLNPLIGDLGKSYEALVNKVHFLRQRVSVSQTCRTSYSATAGGFESTGTWVQRAKTTVYVSYKDIRPLSMGNPLEVIWELTPFSFVVDWMIPVGNWLSAIDALGDVDSITGSTTVRDRKETAVEFLPGSLGSAQWGSNKGSYYVSDQHKRIGAEYGFSATPTPYKPTSSTTALMNAVALLGQLRL